MTDSTTVTQYESAVRIAACVLAVAGLLYAARQVTDALWFWGGTHCTTTAELQACTGILPVGIMFTTLVGAIVGNVAVEFGKASWRRLA